MRYHSADRNDEGDEGEKYAAGRPHREGAVTGSAQVPERRKFALEPRAERL